MSMSIINLTADSRVLASALPPGALRQRPHDPRSHGIRFGAAVFVGLLVLLGSARLAQGGEVTPAGMIGLSQNVGPQPMSAGSTTICPFEDAAHCQGIESGQFIHSIDRDLGHRIADDFRPATDTISRICWFACFVGDDQAGGFFECSGNTGGTPPPDDFVAVFYEDDLGIPGLPVAGQPPGGYSLIPDDKLPSDGGAGNSRCWRYTAPLDPPLLVTPGGCYWLEITGVGEQQAQGYCGVFLLDSQDGNNLAHQDSDEVWEPGDLVQRDLAWCLDSGIVGATDPPFSLDGGCGVLPGACCLAGPTCENRTHLGCVDVWQYPATGVFFPYQSCDSFICPSPINDSCYEAIEICIDQMSDPDLGSCVGGFPSSIGAACSVSLQDCFLPNQSCQPRTPGTDAFRCRQMTDNRLATTDGPNTVGTHCFGAGQNSFQADVWYSYEPPCTGKLTIRMCDQPTYDSMLAVYGTNVAGQPCDQICPLLVNNNSLPVRACNDDYCPGTAGTSGLATRVAKAGCYLIRVGGWSDWGTSARAWAARSEMDIGLLCYPLYELLAADSEAAPPRNRYVSFVPNNPDHDTAIRVRKTTPPMGDCWVTAPDANGLAGCGSSPVYHDWPFSVIHVGDCAIVPDATYEVAATLEGVVFSDPLIVGTVPRPDPKLWGDTVGEFNGGLWAWTAPNGIVNTNDFLAALQKFQNLPTAPHVTVTDVQSVSSTDPCLNRVTNIADVFILIQAFQGNAYPFTTDPASCPPCP